MSQFSHMDPDNEVEPFHEAPDYTLLVQVSAPVEPTTEEIPVLNPLQSEDLQAFTRLFEEYSSKVCTYLARLVGDDEIGRELAQETFIKAWQNLSSLRNPEQPEAWLFRIARNTGIDYLRRQRVRQVLFPWTRFDRHSEDLSAPGFEEAIYAAQHIRQALAGVKGKARECLILYVIVGLSRKRIAELLEIAEDSVSTYVSLGRKQFRDAYLHLRREEVQ